LIFMDWSDKKAEAEIQACQLAGYAVAGVVAMWPDGELVGESIADDAARRSVLQARDEFGMALAAELVCSSGKAN
jgi:hypothetical protein